MCSFALVLDSFGPSSSPIQSRSGRRFFAVARNQFTFLLKRLHCGFVSLCRESYRLFQVSCEDMGSICYQEWGGDCRLNVPLS